MVHTATVHKLTIHTATVHTKSWEKFYISTPGKLRMLETELRILEIIQDAANQDTSSQIAPGTFLESAGIRRLAKRTRNISQPR